MKAVTIAKIARLIVIIAVIVVLAIPTFSGLESYRVNDGEFVMTNSIYELDCMTADDLSNNIKDAMGDGEGYTISYGSVIGKPVPSDNAGRDALAAEIKTAATPGMKATLMDPEGNIAKQMTIMGSGDGYTQYIFTGLKLTVSMVNTFTPTISLESVINGTRNKISDVEITKFEDSFGIKMEIPYLLFGTALAASMINGDAAKIGMSIGIEYNSFFTMNLKLDLPLKDMIQGFNPEIDPSTVVKVKTAEEGQPPITYPGTNPAYTGLELTQEVEVDVSGFSGVSDLISDDFAATIGDFGADGGMRIEVGSDGKVHFMADQDKLVDALMNSREEDGSLIIHVDGSSDPIVITAEQFDSFYSMADQFIDMAIALNLMEATP